MHSENKTEFRDFSCLFMSFDHFKPINVEREYEWKFLFSKKKKKKKKKKKIKKKNEKKIIFFKGIKKEG